MTEESPRRKRVSYRKFSLKQHELDDGYDVVVIGAGIAGLMCANYLQRFELKVLLVEQHWIPGGLCSTFKRKGFLFDAGAHFFGALGKRKSFAQRLIQRLDLDVTFLQLDPVDVFHFPDEAIALPADLDMAIVQLQKRFPSEAETLQSFFETLKTAYSDFTRVRNDSVVLNQMDGLSWSAYLDRFFEDPRLKAVLSATVGYIGVFPAKVSAIAMAAMLMSYLQDGGFVAEGGSQALADSMMKSFHREGGDLVLSTAVEEILLSGSSVSGVRLAGGRTIQAARVVSAGDALNTFESLLNGAVDSAYLQQLRDCQVSNSCTVVYMGVDCERALLEAVRGWHLDSWDLDDAQSQNLYLAVPTLEDPSIAPEGKHIVIAMRLHESLDDLPELSDEEAWARIKAEREKGLMTQLRHLIPDLDEKLVVVESASRRTIYRYTRNAGGSIYGWESTPEQSWKHRLSATTPIDGLYLCGHWTAAGPGIVSVIASGYQVAGLVSASLERVAD